MLEKPMSVRVLHPDDLSQGNFFATEIAGNQVVSFGIVEIGAPCLKIALATTDQGETFPAQYHDGGIEIAVILSGGGAIEVLGEQTEVHIFNRGDIVLIPADVVYRVQNRQNERLLAWIFFGESSRSYWSDGRPA